MKDERWTGRVARMGEMGNA